MRLDHLLSKEEEVRVLYTVELLSEPKGELGAKISGVDAAEGNTRTHPKHDG